MLIFILFYSLLETSGHIQERIRSGQVPVRGVNLGGWLVAENWINSKDPLWDWKDPQNVKSRGEFPTMQFLGRDKGQRLFDTHHRTFITESDIAQIAQMNLNVIRVPIGYWIRGCDDAFIQLWPNLQAHCKVFPQGSWQYLETLVRVWSRKYNIAVLVDIHGAPGSQNGQDHSGEGCVNAYWSAFPENVLATRHLVNYIVDQFTNEPAFLGVGLLNEPMDRVRCGNIGTNFDTLLQYYRDVITEIRKKSDCILVTAPLLTDQSPGSGRHMDDFGKEYKNIWHEWHPYVNWQFNGLSKQQLVDGTATNIFRRQNSQWHGNPLLLSEWSMASPIEPANVGQFMQQFISMLATAKAGWTMWTWKTNGSEHPRWCLQSMLKFSSSVSHVTESSRPISIYNAADKALDTMDFEHSRLVNTPSWIDQVGRAPEWSYNSKTSRLKNLLVGSCLAARANQENVIRMEPCSANNPDQQWLLLNHSIHHPTYHQCVSMSSETLRLESCNPTALAQYFTIGTEQAYMYNEGIQSYVGTMQRQIKLIVKQLWIIDHSRLTIKDERSGQCLDAYQPWNYGIVHLFPCQEGNPNQRWRYDPTTRQLRHATHSNYCYDVYSTVGHHLYTCHSLHDPAIRNQQFQLQWSSYEFEKS